MQEEEDLGGIGVAFRKGEQVEVVMADVEILSSRTREQSACYSNTHIHASPWNVHLYPRPRNRAGRRSSLLRLRIGGQGIFRRRTWGCRLCSSELGGSWKSVRAVLER